MERDCMRRTRLASIVCLAAAATLLASCARPLPQTALERRYMEVVRQGPRWRPAVQRPATEEERQQRALDADMEALVRGEVRDESPIEPAVPSRESSSTESVVLPSYSFLTEPVVPSNDNFERCISGL